MWRVITFVALLWPSHMSGWFDGAPVDSLAEALLIGLIAASALCVCAAAELFERIQSARVKQEAA